MAREPAVDAGAAGVAYWRARARELGAHAVVSTDHAGAELEAVSARHRELLLPAVAALLPFAPGPERTALDLGCGTGRLTADLAALVGGRAVGVDPVDELRALAPAHPTTRFVGLDDRGGLPVADGSIDLVFTCLVLGGIPEADALASTGWEIARVLAPGGLVVLAESVSDQPALGHWTFRSVADYAAALPWAGLREVSRFDDAGDAVSVLAGRKPA